ncbi:short-chain dehydrogenase [Penicillium angulare]|uniref:short-chain dehydrogenase n=1 Tax=Penicillium angulare TaxID=116970 RepID=UPI0025424C7D|nr:short-chain dehydrogenase [Penicillium angulare]KAJ5281818.1 short-chain dehydrogenase [Penicillium angulare]
MRRTHVHPAIDLSIPEVRETFEVNVFGMMAMISTFSGFLIVANGLVINIASSAAVLPYTFGSAYCASKGAIVSYSRTLRQELEPLGVRVMVCMAGTVRSNIHNKEYRSLATDSVYLLVDDVFQKRQRFVNKANPYDTKLFSKELVASALSYEVPWLLRSWFGRPDWFWSGGLARGAWWRTTIFGEWLNDWACSKIFDLSRLSKKKAE